MVNFSSCSPAIPTAIIDGRNFHTTTNDRNVAEQVAEAFNGTIEEYGVRLIEVDVSTNTARRWEKTSGYSVWVP